MSRPTEPEKKEELLKRCLNVVMKEGGLNWSINAIAKKIGTSGRMLVYHFGSKQELEKQIIALLETLLREKLWSFQSVSSITKEDSLTDVLVQMWRHLTSPTMYELLKLTMVLNQRAIEGDSDTQIFLETESQKWVESLFTLTKDRNIALAIVHLFQGAILDFLTTRNAERGEKSIQIFMQSFELTKTQREEISRIDQ